MYLSDTLYKLKPLMFASVGLLAAVASPVWYGTFGGIVLIAIGGIIYKMRKDNTPAARYAQYNRSR